MLTNLSTSAAGPGPLATVQYPESPQLKTSIPVANAMYSPSGMHITFVLHLTDESNDLTWHCTHRYSSFRALHHSIGKHFVGSRHFPSLLFTNKANRSKQEIDQRRRKLEVYMSILLEAIFALQLDATSNSNSNSGGGGVAPFHRVAKILQFLEYPFVDQWDDILKLSAESESAPAPASLTLNNSSSSTVVSSLGISRNSSFGNINGTPAGGSFSSANGVGGNTDRYTPRGVGGVNGNGGWEEDDVLNSGTSAGEEDPLDDGSYTSSQCGLTNITGKSSADRASPPDHQPITSIRSQWRRPYKLPGPSLGLSLPFASLVLSIDAEWEVNVRGDKGTKRGQLRHRYDELTALCAYIHPLTVLPEVRTVQDFIAGFRRRHPLPSYLRMDSIVAESSRVSQRSSHLSDESGASHGHMGSDSSSDCAPASGPAERAVVEGALYVAERGLNSEEEEEEDDGSMSLLSSTQSLHPQSYGGVRRASDGTLDVRRTSRLTAGGTTRRLGKGPNSKHYNLRGNIPLPPLPACLINSSTTNDDIAPLQADDLPPQTIPINSVDAIITGFHQGSHNSLFYDASLAQPRGASPRASVSLPGSPDKMSQLTSSSPPLPLSGSLMSNPGGALFLSSSPSHARALSEDNLQRRVSPPPAACPPQHHDPHGTPMTVMQDRSEGDLSSVGAMSRAAIQEGGDRSLVLEGGVFSPKPHMETRRSMDPHFPPISPKTLTVPGQNGSQGQGTDRPGTPPRSNGGFSPIKVPSSAGAMNHLDQIKGDSVYGCRCSRRYFCVSAEASGDIYVTKSNQAIVVVPPPFAEQIEERDTGNYEHPLQLVRKERLRRHYQEAKIVSSIGAAVPSVPNSVASSVNATPSKKKKKPPALVIQSGSTVVLPPSNNIVEDEELEASLISPSVLPSNQHSRDSLSLQDSFSAAMCGLEKPIVSPVSTQGASNTEEEEASSSGHPMMCADGNPEEPRSSLSTMTAIMNLQNSSVAEGQHKPVQSGIVSLKGARGSVVDGEEDDEYQ